MKCANCNKREGTETWVGDGGVMGYVHGNYQMWCKVCVLEAQIEHCREAAERLADLEQELVNELAK
jgi:hypothetical protein